LGIERLVGKGEEQKASSQHFGSPQRHYRSVRRSSLTFITISQFLSHRLSMHMFEFCLPTTGTKVPSSPDWLHEIKFDGYRLSFERNGDRVRLIIRGGLRGHVSRYDLSVKTTSLVALI
jgi:ATP-dependent DNA ligase